MGHPHRMSSAFFQICGTGFVRFSMLVTRRRRVKTSYAETRASSVSFVRAGSIFTPGPMVEETVTLMM